MTHLCDDNIDDVPVFGFRVHLGVIVDLLEFEVGVAYDQLVFCADG